VLVSELTNALQFLLLAGNLGGNGAAAEGFGECKSESNSASVILKSPSTFTIWINTPPMCSNVFRNFAALPTGADVRQFASSSVCAELRFFA